MSTKHSVDDPNQNRSVMDRRGFVARGLGLAAALLSPTKAGAEAAAQRL